MIERERDGEKKRGKTHKVFYIKCLYAPICSHRIYLNHTSRAEIFKAKYRVFTNE